MSFGIPVRNGLAVGLLASTFLSSLRIGGRPAMFLNFIGTNSLDSRVTFTRATTATFVDSNGLIQSAAINAPRFDYDPVTLAPRGLLIEEQRTNLLTYSEQFDSAAYTNNNVTVTANATAAPDGTTTADLLTAASAASVNLQQSSAVAATSATYGIFAKKSSGATQANTFRLRNTTTATTLVEVTINYDTGVLTYVTGSSGATAVNFGNGWWRIVLTATTGITSGNTIRCDQCFVGPATIGHNAFVWGAQLEAGAFATSYIPTVASTVTRNADVAQMTGTNFSSWYNQSEGTFVVAFDRIAALSPSFSGGLPRTLRVTDAGNANFFILSGNSGTGEQLLGRAAGADTVSIQTGVQIAANTTAKESFAYRVNDFALSVNGAAPGADTSSANPSGMESIFLGDGATATRILNGHLRQLAYFNTRLPNATLQVLSA